MYPNELDLWIRQEQYKDLLHEADRERLIKTAGLHNSRSRKLNLNITNWLGAKMVSWGLNLQQSKPAAISTCCNPCS